MATWHLADARSKLREKYVRFVSTVALDDSCLPSAAAHVTFSLIIDNRVSTTHDSLCLGLHTLASNSILSFPVLPHWPFAASTHPSAAPCCSDRLAKQAAHSPSRHGRMQRQRRERHAAQAHGGDRPLWQRPGRLGEFPDVPSPVAPVHLCRSFRNMRVLPW